MGSVTCSANYNGNWRLTPLIMQTINHQNRLAKSLCAKLRVNSSKHLGFELECAHKLIRCQFILIKTHKFRFLFRLPVRVRTLQWMGGTLLFAYSVFQNKFAIQSLHSKRKILHIHWYAPNTTEKIRLLEKAWVCFFQFIVFRFFCVALKCPHYKWLSIVKSHWMRLH